MVGVDDIDIWGEFNHREYDIAIAKSVIYAVLSVPYTYDRKGCGNSVDGIRERIRNIAKGKVGEYLFLAYCKANGISLVKGETETPFWRYDRGDFIIGNRVIDIKNNYLWGGSEIVNDEIMEFPALVPKDQYRTGMTYVFTFINDSHFFDIDLSDDVLDSISQLNEGCCGRQIGHRPSYFVSERLYFEDLFGRFGKQKIVRIFRHPPLIVAGCADSGTEMNNIHPMTFKFETGTIRTVIENKMTLVKNLNPLRFYV